jgi:hypothetical protein
MRGEKGKRKDRKRPGMLRTRRNSLEGIDQRVFNVL